MPPRIAALDTNTIATADAITRALLVESVRETLERRLAAERPLGTYDDTRAGHDAFSRGVVEDYDHGNHHLARATICPADPGLVTCAGLSHLGLPDTEAPGSLPATSVPKDSVTRIVLSGNVGLSAGARSWAMRGGVDVVCLSRRGSYQGALIGANRGAHASRLLAQVALTGDHTRVHLASALISAKIRSQIHVLTRIARRDETVHVADTTAHMHAWRRSLAGARTLDEIDGHRRHLLQRLLRRAFRVCARRRHFQRAQPTPTPRPA